MSPDVLAYPFLFLAIFFESFILVTLLSRPSRESRELSGASLEDYSALPSTAVIVPCWNESSTVAATCESLLALQYPKDKLEIVLVNDGSTDNTAEIMNQYALNPQVRIVHKENGGKHTALNAGIAVTEAEIVGCLDADSFVDKDALLEIVPLFNNAKIAAVTAAMSVHQPKNSLQHMQNAEYFFGITMRHTISSVNGLYVTPGPFSFYRRSVVQELGGFRYGHQTEDMEMALRIQQAGHEIGNAPHARVYTKAPSTLGALIKQRTRWTSGFLRNILGEYRGLLFKRKYGALGVLMLPTAVLSIGSGMLLFFLSVYLFAEQTVSALSVRAGVPLTYAFLPKMNFDWFYFPSSAFLFLGVTTVIISTVLIVIGKNVSKTPARLGFGIFSYVLLYGLVVTLWLIRASTDVALGKRRGWRY